MSKIDIYTNTSQKYFKQLIDNYILFGYKEIHLYDEVKKIPSLTCDKKVIHCTNPSKISISPDISDDNIYLIRYTKEIPSEIQKQFKNYINHTPNQYHADEVVKYLNENNIYDMDFIEIEDNKYRNDYKHIEILKDTNTIDYWWDCYNKILQYLWDGIDPNKLCDVIQNYPDFKIVYTVYDIFRNLFIIDNGNLEQCFNPVSRTGLNQQEITIYNQILEKNESFDATCRHNMNTLISCLDMYKEGKLTEKTLKNIAICMLLLGRDYED